MGGILKNPLPQEEVPAESEESISDFRKQVFMNTQLNAKLTSNKNEANNVAVPHKHVLPKDTLSLKHQQEAEERLQWNQKNLAANEITKQQYQDIHIDEPKTPYQGAVDPSGEYYKSDEEEEEGEGGDLDGFSLGEPEFNMKKTNGVETSEDLAPAEEDLNQDSEEQEQAEAKHRRFEEMRKKHYNLKEVFQKRRTPNEDEGDDDKDS